MKVLGLVGSPSIRGRTSAAVGAVLAACADSESETIELGELGFPLDDGTGQREGVIASIASADAVVIGTPIYRASFSGLLKSWLDFVPRGAGGEPGPLRAKPVAMVATGASDHHFLAIDRATAILCGFFSAYVVPPGLYAQHEDFVDGELSGALREHAGRTGAALVALADALGDSPALASVRPQI